ncbi:MAG: hypothetical protein KJ718_02130 [Nanoarchaeota archaeon]|nr:hypothetical protein [Nanoarchaeota archaeon]
MKMNNKHLSFEELKESGLRFDPQGWGVELILGVVIRAYSEPITDKTPRDEHGSYPKDLVEIGEEGIEYHTLVERLELLSTQTGKKYSRSDIDDKIYNGMMAEPNESSLVAVGRVVPGLMHAGEQDHNGFVKYSTLIEHLNQHQEIMEDLESIGCDILPALKG